MDLLYLAYYLALFAIPIVAYIVIFKKEHHSKYSIPTWYYLFKKLFAKTSIQEYLAENRQNYEKIMDKYKELPKQLLTDEDSDTIEFLSTDQKSNTMYFSMSVRRDKTARISLEIHLNDGSSLQLPSKDNFIIASRAKNNWCAAGFNIEICDPFKRCRFYFNGFLKKRTADGLETAEHVRLNFIWNSASRPLFYPENFNENLFLDAICREPWTDGNWTSLLGDCVGYQQYGALIGQIAFDEPPKNIELQIPTLKKRTIGLDKTLAWNRDVAFFLASETGDLLHFGVTSLKYGCTHLKFGSVCHSNGIVESITGSDMFLGHLGENGSVPTVFTIHITTASKVFKCVFHCRQSPSTIESREKSGFTQILPKFEVCINSHIGTCLGIFWYQTKGEGLPSPKLLKRPLTNAKNISNFIINLSDSNSQILPLTGGKGSSLGILKSLQGERFKVPDGFVITTEAFKHQLEEMNELKSGINDLVKLNQNCSDEELKIACENLTDLFARTPIGSNICVVVKKELSKLISNGVQFAVRSSGTIEDGDDLSCAGQNQTILGCKSENDVIDAISKCWGSLYHFNSVKYRKQNGFPIRSEIAVIVQQLVPSEVSGVLFTCHPTDSNTAQMLITANYGLGESVVSGSADVDVIVLNKPYNSELSIHLKQLGGKATKIVADGTEAKSVEKSVDEQLTKKFSLTEEQALELGRVGLYLEEESGNSRDIEWAYANGQLYLLQSRAVTTVHQWTDYELLHEFDRPILTDLEVHTTANVGEVIPFANCPLAISTVHQQLEYTMQILMRIGGPTLNEYTWHSFGMFCNHFSFNVINSMLSLSVETYDLPAKISDLSIFGHLATKAEYIRTARERHGPLTRSTKMSLMWESAKYAWNNKRHCKFMHQYSAKFLDHLKELEAIENSKDALVKLQDMVLDIRQVYKYHALCSRVSIISQMVAVMTLLQGKEEFTNDTFQDISLILTSNGDNVVSAEVPRKMQEISGMILEGNLSKEFCTINKKCGVEWLKENCPKASQCFKYFLQQHGHRSFKELELYSKSWAEDPSFLIDMIQQNVKHKVTAKEKPHFTVEETFAQFKVPIKSKITVKILKWLMVKCRQAVEIREESKSELVRCILRLRFGFYHLAKLLNHEGIIPDEELVFFFTIEELADIINTPNPLLLSKALKRRRLFPVWNALRFPEISEGLPKPIQQDMTPTPLLNGSTVFIAGTPVCKGTITARACVIKLIEDSDQLESGDILITVSTDIAWSPYFPILGGIVTELGGLISHGAVVAREYGLPCLVGVKDAARTFKTGDMVCLDSSKGTITLVNRP